MKRLLALAAALAALSGCSSLNDEAAARKTNLQPLVPYAALDAQAQQARLTQELRVLSVALQAYAKAHNGQLPPRLTNLVAEAYLPAGALVSSADPSGGNEGGVPDRYSTWTQSPETDEKGSSYFYEFSEAPCKWEWKSYLGDAPAAEDVDADRNGTVTWAEVKNWQMLHGDTVQKPKNWPYSASRFPAVRCYWYQYPDAATNTSARVILNLAADLQTIFISQPWWEKDGE